MSNFQYFATNCLLDFNHISKAMQFLHGSGNKEKGKRKKMRLSKLPK